MFDESGTTVDRSMFCLISDMTCHKNQQNISTYYVYTSSVTLIQTVNHIQMVDLIISFIQITIKMRQHKSLNN